MKTIAFDIMGNDNGMKAGIDAVTIFLESNLNYSFILVGDKKQINKYIKENKRVKIYDVPKTVDTSLGARAARSDDNSMAVAVKLVKDKKADVVISQGDSGIYLSILTLILKRLDGIKRPAFMPIFPTIIKNKKFLFMDAGANLETTSEMLIQWAKLGESFSKTVMKIREPKVGLINIGTEDKKGFEFTKEANVELKKNKEMKYIGFIEPRKLLDGEVDVVIVDGYAGNMILKSMEGAVLSILTLLKQSLMAKLKYKIGAFMAKGAFSNVKETFDYRNIGAAWVVGLKGLAVKAHGGSDIKSYLGAFSQIKEAIDNNALNEFVKVVK